MKQSAQGHAAGEQQSWDLNTGILSPKIVVVITTQASGCLPGSCSLINRNPPQLAARVEVTGVGVPCGLVWSRKSSWKWGRGDECEEV